MVKNTHCLLVKNTNKGERGERGDDGNSGTVNFLKVGADSVVAILDIPQLISDQKDPGSRKLAFVPAIR